MIGLFGAALIFRLWGLGSINALVFDEVYYVDFALDYLQGNPTFDAHPPLGKYLIAIGIALMQPVAATFNWPQHDLAEVWLSPLSHRWMNALVGACLPPLTALLAYCLSKQLSTTPEPHSLKRRIPTAQTFGLLAGTLMLFEGLTLVESRFGLINIYWVAFGVLGQVGLLQPSLVARILGAIALGAAISVKWNGAGFALGIGLYWGLARLRRPRSPLAEMPPRALLAYCALIPAVVYLGLWIPHLQLNPTGLAETHRQIWGVHQSIANQPDAHPYCSPWFTWPLMLRPIAYYYDQITTPTGPTTVTDVHGMGNPVGWWLGTAAIVALGGDRLSRWRRPIQQTPPPRTRSTDPISDFLLVNYAANWLPWALVSRCTFLYLYMGSLAFAQLALAWLMSRWLTQRRHWPVILLLALIGAGFVYWLPVFLGLPISQAGFTQRMWLRSWI